MQKLIHQQCFFSYRDIITPRACFCSRQEECFRFFSSHFAHPYLAFSGSEEDDPHLQEERKQSLPLMPSTATANGGGGSCTPGAASSTSSSRPRSPRPKLTREKEQVRRLGIKIMFFWHEYYFFSKEEDDEEELELKELEERRTNCAFR